MLRLEAQTAQAREFMPSILPQSPEATSFAKFGNYQVNLFTGLPDISIPLYEIKVGEISVPISINYHASGVKVNDWGSWVGTGWSLSAGGSVSRRIMGLPDEQGGNNYLSGNHPVRDVSTLDLKTTADLDYIKNINAGIIDGEPDIFSYNFPGKSGQFVFNQNDGFNTIKIPYDPVAISYTGGYFDIKNESGVTFQFHDAEFSQFYDVGKTIQGKSTWVLTKVFSANKQDSINFSYTARSGQVSADIRDFVILNDNVWQGNYYTFDLGTGFTDNLSSGTDERKIQQITFPNGKIVFDASTADRADAFIGQKSLTDIKVYALDIKTNTYALVKMVIFNQSYFVNSLNNTIKRLRLDGITITDNAGVAVENYQFTYNTSVELPDRLSRARDYWGYYNGKNNDLLVPRTQVSYQSSQAALANPIFVGSAIANGREPDPNYNQAYILKTIGFPTGGHTDFEYETNQYQYDPSTVKYAGGLRVKSIKSYDGFNPIPIVKTYKYGVSENGIGRANFNLASSFFQTTQNNQRFTVQLPFGGCDLMVDKKRVRTFVSNPSLELEPYDGSPVNYSTVTEYTGDATSNIGKTIYVFNDHADGLNTTVTLGRPVVTTYYANRGQLIDKQIYKKLGSTFQIVAETQNSYSAFPEQFYYNLGVVVSKTLISDNDHFSDIALPAYNDMGACNYTDTYNFQYVNYSIRTDDNKLTQTTNYTYDQNDPSKVVVTTASYNYDNLTHLQPTRIYSNNGAGDVVEIVKKYPVDFNTTAPYNLMIGQNILDKVVQEQKLKIITASPLTTAPLYQQNNNYSDAGNGNYLVNNIQFKLAGNSIETRANFNSYDTRGNITEMQKSNDIKMSYIWDYQKIYPVAQVANAAIADIAYTSFEADGNGGWTGINTANIFTDSKSVTGKRRYSFPAGSTLTKTALTSTNSYVVSYWSSISSPYSVSGTSLNGTPAYLNSYTLNGQTWYYFEHKITGTTSITITGSGTGSLDELRLYPLTAQMTTYTYNPLVGITSKSDINSRINYFEYDSYNRLKLIRDLNGNIIKTFSYKYQSVTP